MRSFRIYIGAGVLLLILYSIAEYNRPVPTDWSLNYSRMLRSPFGTFLLHERLTDLFPQGIENSRESLAVTLGKATSAGGKKKSFLLISPDFIPDSTGMHALFQFLKAGNSVFLASDNLGRLLLDTLHIRQTFSGTLVQETRQLRMLTEQKRYTYQKGQLDGCFYGLNKARLQILGRNDRDSVNFVAFRIGRGSLYLHSNPSVFTNINLMHVHNRRYAAAALSFLPANHPLIWDDFTVLGPGGVQSPMRFVLAHDDLRWAWYLATGLLLAYVLVEIKRRQRIIPVIRTPENRSLEFVNVVGQVYYETHDNADLVQKMQRYFSGYLRSRFDLTMEPDEAGFADLLIRKSGAEAGTVHQLLATLQQLQNQNSVADSELSGLNSQLEKFYQQTR